MMMSRERKPAFVGAKLSSSEKGLLESAAKIRGLTLSRFLVESALKEARGVVGDAPASPARKGPVSHEDRGQELALSIKSKLVAKFGIEEARSWLDLIREAVVKNDHVVVWNYLSRCLPEEIRQMPEKRQVTFLKSFLKAFPSASP